MLGCFISLAKTKAFAILVEQNVNNFISIFLKLCYYVQYHLQMGAARSALRRTVQTPVQTQRQIDKVLDRKPTLAPKHETTKDLLDAAKQGW